MSSIDQQHSFRPTLIAAALALACQTTFAQSAPALDGTPAGETRGGPAGVIDVHQYFTRLAELVTRALQEVTPVPPEPGDCTTGRRLDAQDRASQGLG